MASVYTNNLTLTEIATGEQAGVWGFTTNVNLELIGEAMGSGTYSAFPTDADSLATLPNGTTSALRSIWLDLTSTTSLTAKRTLTIGPNTISRLMFIQNSTTGGQTVTIAQGSGTTVDIPSGQTKAIILNGAGAAAAVTDALLTLTQTQSNIGTLNVAGNADIVGSLTANQTTVGTLDATGNTTIVGTLDVSGNTTIVGTLDATGNTSIDGTLDVSGNTVIVGSLTAGQTIVGSLDVSGNAVIGGFLTASQTTVAMTATPVAANTVLTWVGKRVVNTVATNSAITLPTTNSLQIGQSIIIMVLSATTGATMTITPSSVDTIKFADPSTGTYSGTQGAALVIGNGGVIELQNTAPNVYTAFGSGKQ